MARALVGWAGVGVALVGVIAALSAGGCARGPSRATTLPPPTGPRPPLDAVLTTAEEDDPWWRVVRALCASEPDAPIVRLDASDPQTCLPRLVSLQPMYVVLVLPPQDLDVNFAWRWLSVASRLDDDPFVDVCYGVITGATPDEAIAFWQRTQEAAREPSSIAPRLLDCLGPNQLDNDRVIVHRQLFWAGWLRGRIDARGMNNGLRGYSDGALDRLSGYGILHFGGHGYPDRIDQGLTAEQLSRARLSPSIAFSGACSTGVTSRGFEMHDDRWAERTYAPEDTFCLTVLKQPVVAYLAAAHPDHGVPVYQEMEHWLTTGCTLGEVIKQTYDAVVVANGGAALDFPVLRDGRPVPNWTPTEMMLYGTASRVLFGDPRLRLCGPVHEPPLTVPPPVAAEDGLDATVTVTHPKVAYSLMDTFHCDMAAQANGFNDRVCAAIPLAGAAQVEDVTARAAAGGKEIDSRMVGAAVEEWGGRRRLHVQVDLPSAGYQQGPIRRSGAAVRLGVRVAERSAFGGDGSRAESRQATGGEGSARAGH